MYWPPLERSAPATPVGAAQRLALWLGACLVGACASTPRETGTRAGETSTREEVDAEAVAPDGGGDAGSASRDDARRRCLALCETRSRNLRCRSAPTPDPRPNVVFGDNDECFGRAACLLLWSEGDGLAITELNCDALTACTRAQGQGCGGIKCSAAQFGAFGAEASWDVAGGRMTCTQP